MKRRFWQIHLSTAVVLMFVAGVLLFQNITPQLQEDFRSEDFAQYGWPCVACSRMSAYSVQIILGYEMPEQYFPARLDWDYSAIAVNLAFATSCLVILAVLIESRIRRHEAIKR